MRRGVGNANRAPANGHKRYGSRATRTQSKLKRGMTPVSLERMEKLLKEERCKIS